MFRTDNGIPIKGVHLDCRAQMMRFESIMTIIDDLERWGFNTILLEYCDRFPFEGPLSKVNAPDAFTKEQIRAIIAKAQSYGIKIIPLVQCLGHMYWLLRLEDFAHYGEGYERADKENSPISHGFQVADSVICPSHPKISELYREIFGQVLKLHAGCRYFHIGGDEALLDAECPRCQPQLNEEGKGMVLTHHYLNVAKWIRSQGPEPIIWGDMILTYPESLDILRGHVTVMDWDYSSTLEPSPDYRLWGIAADCVHKPETWSALQKEILQPYVYAYAPYLIKPFPFTKLLRDYGFPVIVAPAARSSGDSFVVPMDVHIKNTIAAACVARKYHTLGMVITSWALRRAPWPLTEYALITGGCLLNRPQMSQDEIDLYFAREHFGTEDAVYAQIPPMLGKACADAIKAADIFSSRTYSFKKSTGQFLARQFSDREFEHVKNSPDAFNSAYTLLKEAANKARALLEKLNPADDRHKERVAFWRWACDIIEYFADVAPQMLIEKGSRDKKSLASLRQKAAALQKETDHLLRPIYTDWTMESENQIRFQVHMEYLELI